MENILNEKPCLVNTPQGFSVSYRNKLLYSKYAPKKAICQAIENLTILPGTLFLCCSPVLPYGLKELISRLDSDSFCLLCEFDPELSAFSETLTHDKSFSASDFCDEKAPRLSLSELQKLPLILNEPSYTTRQGVELLPSGSFKRVIRLDFSAGVQFHAELYNQLTLACTNAIMTFWANRMTLVKFGRKYSQNFFRNLKLLPCTRPIQAYFNSIRKPIVVFGAGESAAEGIKMIKKAAPASYHILCADTALQPLLQNGIEADGVFIEEAQSVIKKAFIGSQKYRTQIFAGLSSVPHLDKIKSPDKISFFTTLYSTAEFIKDLENKGLLPPQNNPFGSVGLTTVYYALKFRASEEIPVYIYGLDFSYSAGKTHVNGSLAHKERLLQNTRLLPAANYKASFALTSEKTLGKDGAAIYTSRTLKNYAELFKGLFSDKKNLFDSASTGLNLGIPYKLPETLSKGPETSLPADKSISQEKISEVNKFFSSEHKTLIELRELLTGKIKLPPEEQKSRITKLAASREYLFLHFPDGIHFKYETSFLKRLRTEIDFFLKFI